MRILIAEDDEALTQFVRQRLESENYSVDVVSDGEQARASSTENDYDRVILDLKLPKLDGVSVLRHLRLKKAQPPSAGFDATYTRRGPCPVSRHGS